MLENSRTTFLYYFSQATEFTESTETDKKLHLGIACAVLMWAHPKRGGDFFGTSTRSAPYMEPERKQFPGLSEGEDGLWAEDTGQRWGAGSQPGTMLS